jgi:hypothetical protein
VYGVGEVGVACVCHLPSYFVFLSEIFCQNNRLVNMIITKKLFSHKSIEQQHICSIALSVILVFVAVLLPHTTLQFTCTQFSF